MHQQLTRGADQLYRSGRRTQPQTTTPFPYTTLFRSNNERLVRGTDIHEIFAQLDVDEATHAFYLGRELMKAWVASSTSRDRKSTRLNSSHVEISYAVFCLKKKKTIHSQLTVLLLFDM